MSTHRPKRVVDTTMAQSPGTCHFLNLSLELRDIIYSMLLTTPYCTSLDDGVYLTCPWDVIEPSSKGRAWRFHLYTAILSVNKQISVEATRILYQGNDFILLKDTGMNLWINAIPQFERLTHCRIDPLEDTGTNLSLDELPQIEPFPLFRIDPVLRIEVTVTGVEASEYSQYLITTPEGLRSIIRALWIRETDRIHPFEIINHGKLNLTLDFNLKAGSRYQVLSELITRPWEKINVNELVLRGDIREPRRKYLEKSNLEGPYPKDVAAHFVEYSSLAEEAFDKGDYDAAQWCWGLFEEYWLYISHLTPYHFGEGRTRRKDEELNDVLRDSSFTCHEGLMKLVKACLRQLRYSEAVRYINDAISRREVGGWEYVPYGDRLGPRIMETKLQLCACLALTACGNIDDGMKSLGAAASSILYRGYWMPVDMERILTELTEDLKQTIDNELIRVKSLWRCGRQVQLSETGPTGPEWQVGVAKRSFWEWMELEQ